MELTTARFECTRCGMAARAVVRGLSVDAPGAVARLLEHVQCPTCGRASRAAEVRLAAVARRRSLDDKLRWLAPAFGVTAGILHAALVHRESIVVAAFVAVGVMLVAFGLAQLPLATIVARGEVDLIVETINARSSVARVDVLRPPASPRRAETVALLALVLGAAFAFVAVLDLGRGIKLDPISAEEAALILLVTS